MNFYEISRSLDTPSLIAAIGWMDLSLSGKVGLRATVYYLSTSVLAVILCIILVTTIKPGGGLDKAGSGSLTSSSGEKQSITTADTLMDLVRNMFPPNNAIQATVKQYQAKLMTRRGT